MTNAFGGPGLTTAAELYASPGVPVCVLQLRSEGQRWALARELLRWAKQSGLQRCLVLASCSAHVKADADLAEASPLRTLSCGAEPAALLPLGEEAPVAAARRLLRGSGLARPLLECAEPGSPGSFSPPSRVALGVCCICGFTNEDL